MEVNKKAGFQAKLKKTNKHTNQNETQTKTKTKNTVECDLLKLWWLEELDADPNILNTL